MEAARQELAITGRLAAREARLVLPDGRNIPVFVGGCRLPGDPGTGVGFAFDLSELTRAKAARKRLEVLHRAVLASLEDQIAVLDDDGIVIEVNDAWRRAGERSTAPGGLLPGEDYLAAIHTAAQHGSESCAAVYAAARAVIDGDSARWRLEISVNHGSGMQWFEQTMDALQRPEGGAVVTLRDITARKRAELELQEQHQQLAHLARVAVLGEFSGAMAHEIKQPLTAILGNAEAAVRLLSVEPPDLGAIRECLLDVVADDLRAAKVIQRLRSLLCNAEIQRTPLDMNEVATEVLSLVRSDMQRRHVIARTDFALNLPRVAGDRIQIQQVLLSLMVNACEAMETVSEGERAITLATRLGSRDDEVEVLVCDAGTGIAEGLLERIFDPFVTTKPNGLGLGLAICRSIIRAHAGRLWAERASEGAVFHFTLHSWQENSEEHAQPAPVSIAGSYQEHAMQILVNADNHIVVHEALAQQVEGTVHGALDRFADQVTRVEVHLHDVNSIKAGQNDKRCMMEARLGGLKPIVVTAHAGTLGEAVDAAAGKLQRAIGSTLGRIAGR
jgi:signal transduction histidine kinase